MRTLSVLSPLFSMVSSSTRRQKVQTSADFAKERGVEDMESSTNTKSHVNELPLSVVAGKADVTEPVSRKEIAEQLGCLLKRAATDDTLEAEYEIWTAFLLRVIRSYRRPEGDGEDATGSAVVNSGGGPTDPAGGPAEGTNENPSGWMLSRQELTISRSTAGGSCNAQTDERGHTYGRPVYPP